MEEKRITISPRTEKGKGAVRRLRSQNRIPAVVYGPAIEPMPVTVSYTDLEDLLEHHIPTEYLQVMMENIDGRQWSGQTLLKEITRNPIDGKIIHVDFYVVEPTRKVTVQVPSKLEGVPQGVVTGGELQQFKRKVRISCLPDNLPQVIKVNIASLKVGDSLRVADLPLPTGVKIEERGDQTIVYVAPTRATLKTTGKGGA